MDLDQTLIEIDELTQRSMNICLHANDRSFTMAGFLTPSRPRKVITAGTSSSTSLTPRPAPSSSEAYASYGSTYVHLPSASTSSIRHFSFPSASEDDIELDPSVDPEHAVSVAYCDDASVLVRQLAGATVLELRSMATSTPHATSTSSLVLRVTMPAPLLPFSGQPLYVHPVTGDLTLFVVDVNHHLHRLAFEAPLARLRAGHDQVFAFDVDRMSSERVPIEEQHGEVVWEALGDRSVALGTPEGVLKARWEHGQCQFTPLRNARSGGFRFFGGGMSSPQVSSIAHHYPSDVNDPAAFIYALSADRKLRAWSLVDGESQWTVEDVLDGITGDSNSLVVRGAEDATSSSTPLTAMIGSSPQGRPIIKTISSSSDECHHVVVFTPTPRALDSGGIFRIYKVVPSIGGGDITELYSLGWLTCSSETRGAELIGFEVERVPGLQSLLNGSESDHVWRLWTSWNVGGRALTEWSNVSGIFESRAATAGETLENPWRSVTSSAGLEPTYDSAYFDAAIVADEYDPGNVFGDIPDVFLDHLLRPGNYSMRSLDASLDEFAGNLPEDVLHELDLSSGQSPRSKIAAVIAADVSIRGVDLNNDEVVVAARQDLKLKWLGFLSRVQAEDRQSRWPLALVRFEEEMTVMTREGLSLLQLQDPIECLVRGGDALKAAQAGSLKPYYAVLADSSARQRYLELLEASSGLAAEFGEDRVTDFEAFVEEKIADGLRDCTPIDLVADAYASIVRVDSPPVDLSGLDSLVRLLSDAPLVSLDDYPTFLGLATKVSSWSRVVRTRHVIVTRLLLLASAHAQELDLDTVGRLLVAYQYHANWTWLASLAGGREDQGSLDVDMQSLALGGRTNAESAYSLLHSIAANSGDGDILAIPAKFSFEASFEEIRLANAVLAAGFPKIAGQYAGSLPDGPAILYIYAKAAALTGEVTDAIRAFEHVAASAGSSELQAVLPRGVDSLCAYYRHVSQTFEGVGSEEAMVHFAELSLQESPRDTSNEDVYARLFRTFLRSQRWSEAFSVMMRNPFIDHSATEGDRPLANLIHAMCANDAVPQLLELPFTGIEHLVESELTFKARNSDPRAMPDYHRVLYAWYISKTDFRNAAVVQYQQGKRLGARTPTCNDDEYIGLLAQQAQCYLAALQAFSLVDPKNAWVITTKEGKGRITSYLPLEGRADYVTVDDIRREYNLLLARLQVAHRYDGTLDPAAPLTAEDCVGFFSQIGLYDEAFATASSQGVDVVMVFESLAQRCMEIERFQEMNS